MTLAVKVALNLNTTNNTTKKLVFIKELKHYADDKPECLTVLGLLFKGLETFWEQEMFLGLAGAFLLYSCKTNVFVLNSPIHLPHNYNFFNRLEKETF